MPNCNNSPKPQNVLFSTLGIHKKPFGFCGLNTFNFDIRHFSQYSTPG